MARQVRREAVAVSEMTFYGRSADEKRLEGSEMK